MDMARHDDHHVAFLAIVVPLDGRVCLLTGKLRHKLIIRHLNVYFKEREEDECNYNIA